jgi:hypothetical protein
VPKKIARVTMRTTVWPRRTPDEKKAKGVSAARYSGLHFMIDLRVVVLGLTHTAGPYSGWNTYM